MNTHGTAAGYRGIVVCVLALLVLGSCRDNVVVLNERLARLRMELEHAHMQHREVAQRLERATADLQHKRSEADRARHLLDRVRSELATAQAQNEALQARVSRAEQSQLVMRASMESILATNSSMLSRFGQLESLGLKALAALARIEERQAEGSPEAPPGPRKRAGRNAPGRVPALVEQLRSEDPAERWEAVDELILDGGTAALNALIPVVKDPDPFVRRLVLEGLGKHRTAESVDAVLAALGDLEPMVRAAAAVSLSKLTGQKLPFEPDAKAAERARMKRAWLDWWQENRATFGK